MKIFCSYSYTGRDLDEVTLQMKTIVEVLNDAGHEAYCNLFDDRRDAMNDDIGRIFEHAFKIIDESEALAVIAIGDRCSDGQLLEFGHSLANKQPIYFFQHRSGVDKSYLPRLATKTFVWDSDADLIAALQQL